MSEIEVLAATRMRVVRGAPDDIEVAALVAGLAAVAGGTRHDHPVEAPVPSRWSDRRPRSTPGPDAWRWSLR